MVFNGADSDQFSEIAQQEAKTDTGAKGLNRHFGTFVNRPAWLQ